MRGSESILVVRSGLDLEFKDAPGFWVYWTCSTVVPGGLGEGDVEMGWMSV